MKIIKRFLQLIILVPFGIVMISLAVANRHEVKLALDPFSPEQPVLDFTLPLYMVIFGALLVGVFIGGFMAWLKQGRHRKAAREKRYEAQRWRNEADRQQKRLEKLAADPKSDVPALPASGSTAITKVAM
ncbi:LapA family protein [uncultured Cohaesibacter sp.]|uniref:LapA family protein n=1 Tax=uncultured Cohaesibacter sp. TaxID=1002546 RepID=UPI0029C8508E|nr:LapA family protein [uncultured Cohaesibacter sp.]